MGKKFYSTIQALFFPLTMTENDFWDQYQPCCDGTFLDFYSDYHPDLYGDMAITSKPKTDSEGLSYSTKVPSDLFLTYGIMFKKILDAKENERRPCCNAGSVIFFFCSCQNQKK